eukprot:IDg10853t1
MFAPTSSKPSPICHFQTVSCRRKRMWTRPGMPSAGCRRYHPKAKRDGQVAHLARGACDVGGGFVLAGIAAAGSVRVAASAARKLARLSEWRAQDSHTPHRSAACLQSKSGLPISRLTSLCTSHIQRANRGPVAASTGRFRKMSRKESAHGAHGYTCEKSCMKRSTRATSLRCGAAGCVAASVCSSVHVARPSSSASTPPSATIAQSFTGNSKQSLFLSFDATCCRLNHSAKDAEARCERLTGMNLASVYIQIIFFLTTTLDAFPTCTRGRAASPSRSAAQQTKLQKAPQRGASALIDTESTHYSAFNVLYHSSLPPLPPPDGGSGGPFAAAAGLAPADAFGSVPGSADADADADVDAGAAAAVGTTSTAVAVVMSASPATPPSASRRMSESDSTTVSPLAQARIRARLRSSSSHRCRRRGRGTCRAVAARPRRPRPNL